MKSWKTSSSDRVISVRGSWTLGRFGLLFPSGEDSMPDVSIVIDIDRRLISISDINRWKSIKKKVLTSINIDEFPIEIDNDFFTDSHRLLSILEKCKIFDYVNMTFL